MRRCLAILLAILLLSICSSAQSAPAWQIGESYAAGALASYNGQTYKCIEAHTSMPGWEPTKVPGLWQPVAAIQERATRAKAGKPESASPATKMFAPYTHMTESNSDLIQVQTASGTRFFALAFIISGGGCTATWQGKVPVPVATETAFSSYIDKVRAAGGDVIVSFGGYVGPELAEACPDAASLQAAYQAVVEKYKVTMLDFDIESTAIKDPPSIDRRSQALKALTAANRGLQISFTLPVFPSGLDQTGLDVLKSAMTHGVPVSVVNIMTMDYGYPVPAGNMGAAAISAAAATVVQMQSLGLNAYLGITPMIGMNDTAGETFTIADAQTVLRYAKSNSSVARLSMWSAERDNDSCLGQVSSNCSGIKQKAWEFSHIFQAF